MANKKQGRGKPDDNTIPKGVVKRRAMKKRGRKKKPTFDSWMANNGAANKDYVIPKSQLLDAFLPNRHVLYKPTELCSNSSHYINLNNFSFLENPDGTIQMLSEIVHMNASAINNHINFHDPICLDMAPYMVLNLLENDLESERILGGTVSPFTQQVLEQTEFAKHFNMTTEGEVDDRLDVWPIKIDFCKQSGAETYKDNVAPHAELTNRFTLEIENWLAETGFGLTPEGLQLIGSMIGEVLNNAILHSGDIIGGEAWISGFMVKLQNKQGEPEYVCHISILNLGNSIYESMQSCSLEIKNRIESLVKAHRSKFRVRKYWNEEALWTLYALQDGVTSMSSPEDPRGGRGLMDMISFFSEIGCSENSKLAIVSGNVAININNPRPEADERGMRRLALNDENDLSKAPKKDYMCTLRKPFPGTILTWRFFLNPKHLEKLVNARNDGN